MCPILQVSLIFKAGFDAGFLYILYYIYEGYDMPRLTKCSLEPCPNVVDCYISRPTEKKIFTLFMVVSSFVCILMCICEMIYLIVKKIKKCFRKKKEADMQIFAETHELKPLSVPRSFRFKNSEWVDPTASVQNLTNEKAPLSRPKQEFRSKASVRVDPTASIQNLSNSKAEEKPSTLIEEN